jgi:hypothetical protein
LIIEWMTLLTSLLTLRYLLCGRYTAHDGPW